MSDIATINIDAGNSFDWAMAGGDLATDNGLKSCVLISLFSDRLANADDILPDPSSSDRRGWWADTPATLTTDAAGQDLIGSRLWLLERAKATAQTATVARQYIQEALQWLIDDGVAQAVDVVTQWADVGQLRILLTITRAEAGTAADPRFDLIWQATVS